MKKILMIPAKHSGDYHLELLGHSLNNEGYNIIFPKKEYFYFSMIRNCIKVQSKIIHIHWIGHYSGFGEKNYRLRILKLLIFVIDIFFLKISRKRIVWTIHNLYSHNSYNAFIEKIFRKFISRKVDSIICHCNQAKIKILNEFKVKDKKITVIPQGSYIKCYKNIKSKAESRELLNLNINEFIFLFFGRIKPYKGLISLIKNFRNLKINKNVNLLIVGEPKDLKLKKQIQYLVKNSKNIIVKFEYIPDDEIQIYMNAADIIVLPYKQILNSGEILVAMGFAKPIIAPKIGCIIDLIDEKGSFLYNPLENNSLTKALEKAIKSKDKLEEMGVYNFSLINNLKWSEIGKNHRKIYDRLLSD
ncbi:MAG: glycosyltransferase family 4 protein [Promethearchaeota archaeon]